MQSPPPPPGRPSLATVSHPRPGDRRALTWEIAREAGVPDSAPNSVFVQCSILTTACTTTTTPTERQIHSTKRMYFGNCSPSCYCYALQTNCLILVFLVLCMCTSLFQLKSFCVQQDTFKPQLGFVAAYSEGPKSPIINLLVCHILTLRQPISYCGNKFYSQHSIGQRAITSRHHIIFMQGHDDHECFVEEKCLAILYGCACNKTKFAVAMQCVLKCMNISVDSIGCGGSFWASCAWRTCGSPAGGTTSAYGMASEASTFRRHATTSCASHLAANAISKALSTSGQARHRVQEVGPPVTQWWEWRSAVDKTKLHFVSSE